MIKDDIKYVIAKAIPVMGDCSLTIGKSYEVVHIICETEFDGWCDKEFKYNPKEPMFYITIKADDNGARYSVWNDCFYSTEELRNEVIDGILE